MVNRCSGVVHPVRVNLDKSSLVDLKDYFGKLCSDDTYIEPTPVTISSEVKIPVISEQQAWNLLSALKRTATVPDQIPYWVCKEHVQIFMESLNLHSVFAIIEEASDYHPLPKVDVPKGHSYYRGIIYNPCHNEGFRKNCPPLPCP